VIDAITQLSIIGNDLGQKLSANQNSKCSIGLRMERDSG
jgi:hypothetical protein